LIYYQNQLLRAHVKHSSVDSDSVGVSLQHVVFGEGFTTATMTKANTKDQWQIKLASDGSEVSWQLKAPAAHILCPVLACFPARCVLDLVHEGTPAARLETWACKCDDMR
jgi:hypothetical protein